MNRSSRFGIKAGLKQSHGTYLYDMASQRHLLDFFGQYSSLAVGYNHPVFATVEFHELAIAATTNKLTNCEILSDIAIDFDAAFRQFAVDERFPFLHYCCTGALGIEAAIKTAIDYTGRARGQIVSFENSFHGINSFGGIITDREGPAKARLTGMPGAYWPLIESPVVDYKKSKDENEANTAASLTQLETTLAAGDGATCIIVEPIQCTAGDRYYTAAFFRGVRDLATKYNVPLIFDEVQTGFCTSGTTWYWEQTGIVPDIVVFGKKAQLSGIMVQEKFAKIFDQAVRLEVTWDADIIDMLRCTFIIRAFKNNDVLQSVVERGQQLQVGLMEQPLFQNVRRTGLLTAFDVANADLRNDFVSRLQANGMLCSPAVDKTIRLRPQPLVTEDEVCDALSILSKTAAELGAQF